MPAGAASGRRSQATTAPPRKPQPCSGHARTGRSRTTIPAPKPALSWTFRPWFRRDMSVTGLIRGRPMLKAKAQEPFGAANASQQDRLARLATAFTEVRSNGRLSRAPPNCSPPTSARWPRSSKRRPETAIDAVRGDRIAVVNGCRPALQSQHRLVGNGHRPGRGLGRNGSARTGARRSPRNYPSPKRTTTASGRSSRT